jgi:hypothetical protein
MLPSLILSFFLSMSGQAKATPTPPTPTSNFCMNNITGALRMMLDKNGFVVPCRRIETAVPFSTIEGSNVCVNKVTGAMREPPANTTCHKIEISVLLQQLVLTGPTPSPTPSATPIESPTPTPSPGPSPEPKAQPTVSGNSKPTLVTDAHSNPIGYELELDGDSFGGPAPNVGLNLSGQMIAVPVDATGFLNSDNGFMHAYYASDDCSGPAYMPLSADAYPVPSQPLVLSAVPWVGIGNNDLQTVYVDNQRFLYYSAPPYSVVSVNSGIFMATIANGTVSGTCGPGSGPTLIVGGRLTVVNLATLSFATPFNVP